jgi:general stress protein 26
MNFEEAKQFMKTARFGFLATTDGSRATVRPMGGWAWVDGELWCATSTCSVKVEDIRKKPGIEYCFSDSEGRHLRIEGQCRLSTQLEDKQKMLDLLPWLAQYTGSVESPGYTVLRMTVTRIRVINETMQYADVPLP